MVKYRISPSSSGRVIQAGPLRKFLSGGTRFPLGTPKGGRGEDGNGAGRMGENRMGEDGNSWNSL